MTISEKIYGLSMRVFKPCHQKEPKHPKIRILVPLKHDEAFGKNVLEFNMDHGVVLYSNFNDLPYAYYDICDQEIDSVEEKDQYGDHSCIFVTIHLKEDYLNEIAKKLEASVPNKDSIYDGLEERVLVKLYESSYYQKADDNCKKYIKENVLKAIDRTKEINKKETIIVAKRNVEWLLRNVFSASQHLYEKYETIGKTNQEIIAKYAKEDSNTFALFLFSKLKKALEEHCSIMSLEMWLEETIKE